MSDVVVNGRRYRVPEQRTAVVCLDGVDAVYLDDALERRLMPRLAELIVDGTYLRGRSQLPSFTNPNNLSIVTGVPPAVHGVPGNHYRAPDGLDVQLDRPELLRARTIHEVLAEHGVPVLAVTTKEKLRSLLGVGGVTCVSAEKAGSELQRLVARPKPDIYDWDASHYALELAAALAEQRDTQLLYVSLTDAVQHAAAPGEALSDAYLTRLDALLGRYLDAGWRLGLVADHGMNAKPEIRYLTDILDGAGIEAHVVLPITDPYVAHHAALGSACWLHLADDDRERARRVLEHVTGVEEIYDRDSAAAALSLPVDRIGDLVVLGDRRTVFGKSERDHDLSALRGPLRSHGGRHEQTVPIILSAPPAAAIPAPTNADVHLLVLGGQT